MLYPQENREEKKLESFCKRCAFTGEAEEGFEYVYHKQIIKTAEYVGNRLPCLPSSASAHLLHTETTWPR